MSKLKGKVAVVTGASKGIGAAIAKALAAEDASVVVNYASSKAGADAQDKPILWASCILPRWTDAGLGWGRLNARTGSFVPFTMKHR